MVTRICYGQIESSDYDSSGYWSTVFVFLRPRKRWSNLKSIYIEIEAEIDKSVEESGSITFNDFEASGQ